MPSVRTYCRICEAACGLVADVDDLDVDVQESVVDRHDLVAGETEHGLDAGVGQGSGDKVCAAHGLRPFGCSPARQPISSSVRSSVSP